MRGVWLMLIEGGCSRFASYASGVSAWLMVTFAWFAVPAHFADADWGNEVSQVLILVAMSSFATLTVSLILASELPRRQEGRLGSGERPHQR